MAASVVYSTFGGRVVAESRGGVIRQYVPDNLGSTVALIDDAGNVTDTYDYWPYGEERVHVGTSTSPLTFLGTLGYFKDFLNMLYVRARHLRVDLTQWMTVDPLWPWQRAYGYARNTPETRTDPSGKFSASQLFFAALPAPWYPTCYIGSPPCDYNAGQRKTDCLNYATSDTDPPTFDVSKCKGCCNVSWEPSCPWLNDCLDSCSAELYWIIFFTGWTTIAGGEAHGDWAGSRTQDVAK
ncbi:MAG: hypothetical protein ACYC96_12835 [Fimbriimonadaceae bacterium]